MTIEELRSVAAAINEAANGLAAQFSSNNDASQVAETKPEKKSELTLKEVRAVLAEKSRTGHTATIYTLLQKYGAKKLSSVDPKHYKALLKDAEEMDDGK